LHKLKTIKITISVDFSGRRWYINYVVLQILFFRIQILLRFYPTFSNFVTGFLNYSNIILKNKFSRYSQYFQKNRTPKQAIKFYLVQISFNEQQIEGLMIVRQIINVPNLKLHCLFSYQIYHIKYISTAYLAPIVNRHAIVTQIPNLSPWM
jgi:hypothetical protein